MGRNIFKIPEDEFVRLKIPGCRAPKYSSSCPKQLIRNLISASEYSRRRTPELAFHHQNGERRNTWPRFNTLSFCNSTFQSNSSRSVPGDHPHPTTRIKKRRRRKPSTRSGSRDSDSDSDSGSSDEPSDEGTAPKASQLKADAEEFVPRSLQQPRFEIVNLPPNFIPIPFNPAFLPPAIPINFVPPQFQEGKMVPKHPPIAAEEAPSAQGEGEAVAEEAPPPPLPAPQPQPVPEVKKPAGIDIEKIVYKLEEAAKEQQNGTQTYSRPLIKFSSNRNFTSSSKQKFSPRRNGRFSNAQQNQSKPPQNRTRSPQPRNRSPQNHNPSSPPQNRNRSSFQHQSRFVPQNQTRSPQAQNKLPPNQTRPPPNPPARHHQQNHNQVATTQYSELLKKKPSLPPRPSPHKTENSKEQGASVAKPADVRGSPSKVPTKPNQWISVSSRKRRKNRATEDFEEDPEPPPQQQPDDAFESYDINQLVDVVPGADKIELVEEEGIIEVTVESIQEEVPTRCVPPEVVEEKDPVVEESHAAVEETKTVDEETKIVVKEKKPHEENNPDAVEENESTDDKVRALEVSEPDLEIEEPGQLRDPVLEVPIETEPTVPKQKSRPKKLAAVAAQKHPSKKSAIANEEQDPEDSGEKKQKKKRKKPAKNKLLPSASSSATTLSQLDDSYEFLLENSTIEDFEEKTNVEISQELDKIIQRGMYSSLDEKIRALNVGPGLDDKFFNSIALEESLGVQKPASIKATDFGELLQNAGQLFKKPEEPQPSTSKSGIFLEDPVVSEMIKTAAIPPSTASKNNGVNSKSKHKIEMVTADHNSPSYPITQAVKDWMVKTRESTPDVNILKSPNTILKEFCETEGPPKNVQSNPPPASETEAGGRVADGEHDDEEEEVTLFSSLDRDLLECWENEIVPDPQANANTGATTNGFVEEAEEVVEVYESKYGKNEDFLQLRAEIEGKMGAKKTATNYPKHGNLPYRAICCSIM